jgi:hypothetical protein
MADDLLYDYVSISHFNLNKPPFKLDIIITNFINNQVLYFNYTVENFSYLPKNVSAFLYDCISKSETNGFTNYIKSLSSSDTLHFEVNLNNSIERVHKQYITCKISELCRNNLT